jgi:hypothetical protein
LDSSLKIRLMHVRGNSSSITILNFPDGDTFMSPHRMRALARTLNRAAADCQEKISTRFLDEPVELEYEIDFELDLSMASDQSLLCQMVAQLGVARFSLADLHRVMKPDRYPVFIVEDADVIGRAADSMVRNGMFVNSPGPRGGKGWVLTDAAVAAAKRLARQLPQKVS